MGEVFLNKKPVVEEYEYAYVETADGAITKVPRNKIYPYVPASKEDVEKLSSEFVEEVGKLSQENAELKGDLDTLNQGGLNLKEDFIGTQVNEWLDEHPEATTTVQDRSLTEEKLALETQKKKASYYKCVSDMKADSHLKAGMTAITLGYYSENDGGGGTFFIREKNNDDTEDGGSIHFVNGLVAELIVEKDTVNFKQFGAKSGENEDNSTRLENACKFKKVILDGDTYYFKNRVVINNQCEIHGNNSTFAISAWNANTENWVFVYFTNTAQKVIVKDLNFVVNDTSDINHSKEVACLEIGKANYGYVENCNVNICETSGEWHGITICAKNTVIKNTKIINKSYGSKGGAFWSLILNDGGNYEDAITISGCYFLSNAGDEVLGTDLKKSDKTKNNGNVFIKNTTIIRKFKNGMKPSYGVTLRGYGNTKFTNCEFITQSDEALNCNSFVSVGSYFDDFKNISVAFENCNIDNVNGISSFVEYANDYTKWCHNTKPIMFINCSIIGGSICGRVIMNSYDTVNANGMSASIYMINSYVETDYIPFSFTTNTFFQKLTLDNCNIVSKSNHICRVETEDLYYISINNLVFTSPNTIKTPIYIIPGELNVEIEEKNTIKHKSIQNTYINGVLTNITAEAS